ncbi:MULTISPECIES: segregation and condensation protein A [Nocardiopsis]|uniref:Segregation and condensation protein A n=1 Tax=Nocardiopsis sinuspersici TaxID=501010 RepID=A0A1V3BYM2_9ACTN|nr:MULTISPECIES: ScpA family protein [Nocardiopsis]NYH54439.1 segregation and condensation protein A [Nocardiopsis sinuspersici]OOC53230.1 segregation and condensation protein A [Nocardiopsis sinuspersici]
MVVEGTRVDAEAEVDENAFQVHLDNFEGPFDLLLALISKHKLDITEVSLSRVTDEFIAHIRAYGEEWDLDQASNFLLVAATLLDLKAARLLPRGDVEDEADLALLEARDLLFARLLQYRAYKEVASFMRGRLASQGRRYARAVPLEERFAALRPEVLFKLGPQEFAALAGMVFTPKEPPSVPVTHIHQTKTSVREQGELMVAELREHGRLTFAELTAACTGTFEVVARFLALLELYRASSVDFDQPEPLGELLVTWTGGEAEVEVRSEYDGSDGAGAVGAGSADGPGETEERG